MNVFISYALENKKEAGQLYSLLDMIGFDCFMAHKDIKKGERWREAIVKGLNDSQVFIPLLSSEGMSSPWVHQESGMAHLIAQSRKMVIIPVTVEDPTPPGCLSEYQSISVGLRFLGFGGMDFNYSVASKLASDISDQIDCFADTKDNAISNLKNASPIDYEYILGYLYSNKHLTFNDFLELINRANASHSIIYSSKAMSYMMWLLNKHKSEINKWPEWVKAWNRLWTRYEKYLEEERKRQAELAKRQSEAIQKMVERHNQTKPTP